MHARLIITSPEIWDYVFYGLLGTVCLFLIYVSFAVTVTNILKFINLNRARFEQKVYFYGCYFWKLIDIIFYGPIYTKSVTGFTHRFFLCNPS